LVASQDALPKAPSSYARKIFLIFTAEYFF